MIKKVKAKRTFQAWIGNKLEVFEAGKEYKVSKSWPPEFKKDFE